MLVSVLTLGLAAITFILVAPALPERPLAILVPGIFIGFYLIAKFSRSEICKRWKREAYERWLSKPTVKFIGNIILNAFGILLMFYTTALAALNVIISFTQGKIYMQPPGGSSAPPIPLTESSAPVGYYVFLIASILITIGIPSFALYSLINWIRSRRKREVQ